MEYGLEIFALMPSKMNKLETIFLKTLKVTLCLPMNTSSDKVIKSACILDARTTANLRLVKTCSKMTKRGIRIPNLVQERVKVIFRAMGLDERRVEDVQEYGRACVTQWIKRYWKRPAEDLNFPDGLFQIGQVGDWDLLYMLVGQIIPNLYEKVECDQCGVVRDQVHILNQCPRHGEVRRLFRDELMRIGIRIEDTEDISGWISELQTDPKVRLLEKAKKVEVITVISEFLRQVRMDYLA